jgi:putative addiction module CopG family antidote
LALPKPSGRIREKTARGEWNMTIPLPADLEQYVEEKVAAGVFASRDALVLEAVRLYRELESRHELLKADIQAAFNQSDRGMSAPLDMEAIQRELMEELDERGRPR